MGAGTIPPQCGGNVAKRQKGTARVRGGQSAPQQGIFKGTAVPLNDLLLPFLAFRKGRPWGVRGHGPNGPRRRDLAGPIDHILVKPAASNIPAPPGQGKKLSDR